MEILDAGGGRRVARELPRPDPVHAADVDLDLGRPEPAPVGPAEPVADVDPVPTPPPAGPASAGAAWRSVVSPDAFAAAAFAMAVAALFSGGPSTAVTTAFLLTTSIDSPQEQFDFQGKSQLASAFVVLALVAVAVVRPRRFRTAWGPVVAGGALVLGLVSVAIGAWMLWKAPGLPASY